MKKLCQYIFRIPQEVTNVKVFILLEDQRMTQFVSISIARGLVAAAVLLAANQLGAPDVAKDEAAARADAAGYAETRFD